ncbi:hypothetical protein C8R45DRAFT_1110042 [Mycena sanguinolenta]|nr:hypothetical protein C8R45DRAFT_1110042 [Mycena sanguinolenta]
MALGATVKKDSSGIGWDVGGTGPIDASSLRVARAEYSYESKIIRRLPPPPGDLFSHGRGDLSLCVACSALLADADAARGSDTTHDPH